MAGKGEGKQDGISRRDFLDGVAISAAGLAAAAAAPHLTGAEAALAATHGGRPQPPTLPPGYYPPTATGLTGEPDHVIEKIYKIDGKPDADAAARHSSRGGPGVKLAHVVDEGECYDCVIVGAGASGLAAAKFYRDRFGADKKVLLLDPLPDFGGHSHRNEFHVPNAAAGGAEVTILRNGGTVNLDSIGAWDQPAGGLLDIPGSYGQPALDMLDFCGVDIDNFPSSTAPGIPTSYGLRQMLLFPAADWGAETLAQNRNNTTEPNTPEGWTAFVNRLPYSQAAKDAIVRIQTDTTTDWLSAKHGPLTTDQKLQLLTRITYKQYLKTYVGAPEEAIVQYQRSSHGLLGAGAQAVSAADCWMLGQPGFDGLGLPDTEGLTFPGVGRTPQMDNMVDSEPSRAWPDGNTSLLRLLVSKLIPAAFPDVDGGRPNQENIVKARVRLHAARPAGQHGPDPAQLPRHERQGRGPRRSPRRGRLHAGRRQRQAGRVPRPRVARRHGVLEPRHRAPGRRAAAAPGRRPLLRPQGAADLRPRRAEQLAGVGRRQDQLGLPARQEPVLGQHLDQRRRAVRQRLRADAERAPAAPASLTFTVVPNDPLRVPQIAAYESGREQLFAMSFADLEGALYDVIDRSVNKSGGDFDPERDLHSLTINRWNYGYAHELTSVWDPSVYGPVANQPQVRGRVPFRNVSIANSDSGAMAYTHSAISEGFRAIEDLPEAPRPHRPHHRHGHHAHH